MVILVREIKFRGKAKMSIEELNEMYFEHDNGWFYGNLVMYGDTPYIVGDFIEVDTEYTINEFWVAVHPESVGQYTGLKDKNDKEIYEGDIVEFNNCDYQRTAGHLDDEIIVGEVEYSCGAWGLKEANGQLHDLYISLVNDEEAEVIGNIYENLELIEGETK